MIEPRRAWSARIIDFFDGAPLDFIKVIAAVSMVVDHTNVIVLRHHPLILWQTGRLAFPLFSFVITCNLLRGAEISRYLTQLLVFAACSQPFYYAAFHLRQGNILFTLAAGVAMAATLRTQRPIIQHIAFAGGIVTIVGFWADAKFGVDFGFAGILFPAVTLALLESSRTHLIWFVLLVWSLNLYSPPSVISGSEALGTALIVGFGCSAVLLSAAALHRSPRFLPHRVMYWFYPGHIVILLVLRSFVS